MHFGEKTLQITVLGPCLVFKMFHSQNTSILPESCCWQVYVKSRLWLLDDFPSTLKYSVTGCRL